MFSFKIRKHGTKQPIKRFWFNIYYLKITKRREKNISCWLILKRVTRPAGLQLFIETISSISTWSFIECYHEPQDACHDLREWKRPLLPKRFYCSNFVTDKIETQTLLLPYNCVTINKWQSPDKPLQAITTVWQPIHFMCVCM